MFKDSLCTRKRRQVIHYLVMFNGNISGVTGKRGRTLGVVIFNFSITCKNVSYVFIKFVE